MGPDTSPLIVGLDIGTSGVRTLAFTMLGQVCAEGRASFATTYAGDGWAEQQPDDWWQTALAALRDLSTCLGSQVSRVVGIGLTGQCPTFACVTPAGDIVSPGILYQDNRAVAQVQQIVAQFGAQTIHTRTGQAPGAFYVLPKLLWLQQQGKLPAKTAFVLQPRDLVCWRLTGRFATDPTHAACTLAYDLHTGIWIADWLHELDLAHVSWPDILPCQTVVGGLTPDIAESCGFASGTPVIIGAADSICAAYGARAVEEGVLCEVTGTSTCLHMTVAQPVSAYAVNTYPHIDAGKWYSELGLNTTGGALNWLAALFATSPDQLIQAAASVPPGAEGLYFLPYLSGGERDNPDRQGIFAGLQLHHTSAHLSRALLEGVAYALRARIALLEQVGYPVASVISCGGASRSELWSQIKADIFGRPLHAIVPMDTTAWGAALVVGKALGISMQSDAHEAHEAHDVHGSQVPTAFTPTEVAQSFYVTRYRQFRHLEALFTTPLGSETEQE